MIQLALQTSLRFPRRLRRPGMPLVNELLPSCSRSMARDRLLIRRGGGDAESTRHMTDRMCKRTQIKFENQLGIDPARVDRAGNTSTAMARPRLGARSPAAAGRSRPPCDSAG